MSEPLEATLTRLSETDTGGRTPIDVRVASVEIPLTDIPTGGFEPTEDDILVEQIGAHAISLGAKGYVLSETSRTAARVLVSDGTPASDHLYRTDGMRFEYRIDFYN